MKNSLALILTLGLIAAVVPVQASNHTPAALKATLAKVATAELPAEAAAMVARAPVADRGALAVDVTKCAVKLRPTVAAAIVGAVAGKSPETAPAVAAAAAGVQPSQARLITQAAVAAVPAKSGEIVAAVCKAVPSAYREVALGAAAGNPSASREILAGVASALPKYSNVIDRALAGTTEAVSVPGVLAQLSSSNPEAAIPVVASATPGLTAVRGPAISAPYIPLSGTPTNVPPGGGDVPPGGRDYAAP